MSGAIVSFCLLIEIGINELSLGMVVATCLLTCVSVLLFGRKKA